MPRLAVIVASNRPGRIAPAVTEWFVSAAREHGGFEVEVLDLAEIDLPFLDEPDHPRLRRYTHQHTRDWSARIEAADALVIVTPEYNYGMPAVLKNALDYLHQEWAYKPVAFVSYGGVSAGTRGVQMAKQVVTTLRSGWPSAISDFSLRVAVGQACTQAPQLTHSEPRKDSSWPADTLESKPRPWMVRAKVPCTSSQARTQREQTMHLDGSKVKYGLLSSFCACRWLAPS